MFRLRKLLSEIKDFYSKPASAERFKEYLAKLQGGTKGELVLPIVGFNPMAKDHILTKIVELEKLDAEDIMQETINEFNATLKDSSSDEFTVILNIADDLKGGWTNYYAADFDSKFKLNAFVERQFCVPYFWTSETFSKEMIKVRTKEYLSRTLYRIHNPQPFSLADHFAQEVMVSRASDNYSVDYTPSDYKKIESYYLEHKDSEEHDRILNFFYGNDGSYSLGYKTYISRNIQGFEYARILADKRTNNT